MEKNQLPLVTFALFTYNQEKYIRHALEGVLAQTYSNLEVIISDDCSKDSTFEIIEQYIELNNKDKNIILIKNNHNLGLINHINKVVENSRGELIVVAAGDDFSLPHRVETIVQHWLDNNKKFDSIHSSVTKITEAGEKLSTWSTPLCNSNNPDDYISHSIIIGASHAWTKRLFEFYGPLHSGIFREDRVIGFRSVMLGGVSFIKEPLVDYRLSGMSNTGYGASSKQAALVESTMHLSELKQNFLDVSKFENSKSEIIHLIGNEYKRILETYITSSQQKIPFNFFLMRLISFSKPYLKHIIKNYFPILMKIRKNRN